jgi:DNA-binding NarL/FixJ family response regulator
VLLADDHTMFREGLAGVFASYGDMEVVAEVPNDEQALRLARQERPTVVVMQVQMPFERAKESLRQMRQLPDPPKVVVTMFESPRYMRDLMDLGASAYLIKTSSTQHLIGAIRAAVSDPKSENVVLGMPRGMLEEAEGGSDGVLSARELEILLLAARGLSNHQIAARIHLAEGTLKRHLVEGLWGREQHLEVRAAEEDGEREDLPVHTRRNRDEYSHEERVPFRRLWGSLSCRGLHVRVSICSYSMCA